VAAITYDPLLGFESADGDQRYPLSDLIGTARRLVDESGAATDAYSLDAFGRYMDGWTNQTPNPYRFGGAWGYTTDTPGSGLLQLGQRFYWREVGRFIQQDSIGDGMN
jgi:RHS repeat-associated protein